MIISARLSNEDEQKLLQILKKHKESIAWSIEELKGISPCGSKEGWIYCDSQ